MWLVTLAWPAPVELTVWGLDSDLLKLPEPVTRFLESDDDAHRRLHSIHLAPEAFFLPHDSPLGGGTIADHRNVVWRETDRPNPGKKCCQCQRFLPIDPRLAEIRSESLGPKRAPRNMVLAFHGHRSKKTGYQNECRACKKFEINNHFNVLRSWDQLNESSVLTRERKLLLRENLILENFKERHSKEGLRSFVWNRFGRRCFKCNRSVSLRKYQLDHTRPLAYLWALDEHATCLCSDCNNNKKASFPIEFYSPEELVRLAEIIELPLNELRAESVNPEELARIRGDIVGFAASWSPRLFDSVARRVRDCHDTIDLYEELRQASPELHASIVQELKARPPALDDEGDVED